MITTIKQFKEQKENKIKEFTVRNVDELKEYFRYLLVDLNLGKGFHPDTLFTNYIDLNTNQPTFTQSEAEFLQKNYDKIVETFSEEEIYKILFQLLKEI